MKTQIIKNYTNWLTEEVNQVPPTQTSDAILFISTATSESNITPNLAAKLGIKVDTKYKVEVTKTAASGGLSNFLNLSVKDGSKFGTSIKITEIAAVPKGQDYLSINGKSITETGQIILTKAEVQNGLIIEASNNGLLALARLGDALAEIATSRKIYLELSANFSIKFSLGGKLGSNESTGYSYYWAKPGQLNITENTIAGLIAIAALKLAGYEESIAKTDSAVGSWSSQIDRFGIANIATALPKGITQSLALSKMLIDENAPALQSWSAISANPSAIFRKPANSTKKIEYTSEGLKLVTAVAVELAKSVTPKAVPSGFGSESTPVLASYSNIIVNGLSTPDLKYYLDFVQTVKTYGPASSTPGGSGKSTINQGEGGFGQPKPAQTKG